MTYSLINSHLKERQIKIVASNIIDENNAIVDDDNDKQQEDKQDKKERKSIISRNHYKRNKDKVKKQHMPTSSQIKRNQKTITTNITKFTGIQSSQKRLFTTSKRKNKSKSIEKNTG